MTLTLKHMLGLANSRGDWHLRYLWFDAGGKECVEHRKEMRQFEAWLGPEVARFSEQNYQNFFVKLSLGPGRHHKPYLEYLSRRYFL